MLLFINPGMDLVNMSRILVTPCVDPLTGTSRTQVETLIADVWLQVVLTLDMSMLLVTPKEVFWICAVRYRTFQAL